MAGLFSFSLSKKSQPPPSSSKGGSDPRRSASSSSSPGVFALFQESLVAEEKEQEEAKKKGVLQSVRLSSKGVDRRELIQRQKALEQDASVFSYDEVFENISTNTSGNGRFPAKKILLGFVPNRQEENDEETTESQEKERQGGRPSGNAPPHLEEGAPTSPDRQGGEEEDRGEEEEEGTESLHDEDVLSDEGERGISKKKRPSPSSSVRDKYGGNLNHGLNILVRPADFHRQAVERGSVLAGGGSVHGDRTTAEMRKGEMEKKNQKKPTGEATRQDTAAAAKEDSIASRARLPPSQFISKLVLSARRRELEREIVEERQLKKEREGTKNDEVFVTSAYKRRLEERRLLQLELEKQELRDRAHSADKQTDLTSFHSHLLRSGHASRYGGGGGGGEEGSRRRREDSTTKIGWREEGVVPSPVGGREGGEQGEERERGRMSRGLARRDSSSSPSPTPDGVHGRKEDRSPSQRSPPSHVPPAAGTKEKSRSPSSHAEAARRGEGEEEEEEQGGQEAEERGAGDGTARRKEKNSNKKEKEQDEKEEEREKSEGQRESDDVGEKKERSLQGGKSLSDLLEQRRQMKRKVLEESVAHLQEERIAEAKKRYLERKRKMENST